MTTQMSMDEAPWGPAWQGVGAALTPDAVASSPPAKLPLRARIGAAVRGLGQALNPNGGPFESFVGGAANAYSGTADALAQARLAPALFQQAQEDRALEARLKGAQADYYERGARGGQATPYHFESIPGLGILRSNEMTGESGLVGPQGGAPYVVPIPGVETARTRTTMTPPPARAPFKPQTFTGEDGVLYRLDTRTNQLVPVTTQGGGAFHPRSPRGGTPSGPGAGLTPRGAAKPRISQDDYNLLRRGGNGVPGSSRDEIAREYDVSGVRDE